MKLVLILFTAAMLAVSPHCIDDPADESRPPKQPVELGLVNWKRDLETAKKLSDESGRPIFMLFQEVPGCSTCQDFGRAPLSHPLMVEAIEDLFIPILVYNNKKGSDEVLLKKFQEPAWNNPVVRFLSSDTKDLIGRKDEVWTTAGTAVRMAQALTTSGKPVPAYLKLVAEDASAHKSEIAEFAMHCYWEGEAKLGSISGVKNTRSGWRGDLEVVRVEFDPEKVDYSTLLANAQAFTCASKVYAHTSKQHEIASQKVGDKAVVVEDDSDMREAKRSDQKYYVRNSDYAHLPLTSGQATKINSAIYLKQPAKKWLSPRQLELLQRIKRVKSQDANALDNLIWPDDDSKLADYRSRLLGELAPQVKSPQNK